MSLVAVICPELKLLFFCVSRTASTAISQVLIHRFNGRWLPRYHIRNIKEEIVVNYKHSTYRQLLERKLLKPADIEGYAGIAFTRDPYDWLVSNYFLSRASYERFIGKFANRTGEAGNMLSRTSAFGSRLITLARLIWDMLDFKWYERLKKIYQLSFEEYYR